MRAVIYARVSTKDQDTTRQVSDLQAFAARAGYEVVAVMQEKASGAKNDRAERVKILKMAQARMIDVVLVTELSRWGRSTQDLIATMQDLQSRNVSMVAMNGMQMDLSTPSGKLMATLLAGIAEFERELIQERVKSGIASAKARGKKIGRQAGDNYKSGKKESKIEQLHNEGKSVREIAKETGLGKTTVAETIKRLKAEQASRTAA
ncbi:MAG: recombinase family protein [Candidatus Melainabacteria bacterium]|nr:recombinase family protein [Candidatus Melainabacteria bacterium]